MGYRKRDFTPSQYRGALRHVFPARDLRRAVAAHGRPTRDRLWPPWLLLGALIAWDFRAGGGLPAVLGWLRAWAPGGRLPSDPAVYAARRRLGWKPVWWVRRHCVRWLAAPDRDPAAFHRGRRLLGLDGTTLTVADTPANARTFGRAGNQHKPSGFPVVRVLALCELGTRALGRWVARRYGAGEASLADRLLRHVPAGSLVLGDRNFHSYRVWERARRGRFDSLLRVQAGPKFPARERLADGSYLSEVRPRRGWRGPPIPVRVITYAVVRAGRVTRGRLLTSLLTEADGTARELAELYHRRWEQESAFAEVKGELAGRVTHLRAASPVTALQELDALLLGHYVVRGLILRAARDAGVPPVEVSFAGAIRVLRARLGAAPAARGAARWWAALLAEIAGRRVRRRRRSYPRVRKVVRCPWPVKKPHHTQEKPEPLGKCLKIVS